MSFKASSTLITKYHCESPARPQEVYAVYDHDGRMLCYSRDKHEILPIVAELNRTIRIHLAAH